MRTLRTNIMPFDYGWRVGRFTFHLGKERIRVCEYYHLLGTLSGSKCIVFPHGSGWVRKTVNQYQKGSTRYAFFAKLDDALTSGVKWGRRKVNEAIAEAQAGSNTMRPADRERLGLEAYVP